MVAKFSAYRELSCYWEPSSARPIARTIAQVLEDPYIPNFNIVDGTIGGHQIKQRAQFRWLNLRDNAVNHAQEMVAMGIREKQASLSIEPWARVSVVVSATEISNFYDLLLHPSPQPAFQDAVAEMRRLESLNDPIPYWPGEIYMPWPQLTLHENVVKVMDADGRSPEDTLLRHDKAATSNPLRPSPFEHVAVATDHRHDGEGCGNFRRGWVQYRSVAEAYPASAQRSLEHLSLSEAFHQCFHPRSGECKAVMVDDRGEWVASLEEWIILLTADDRWVLVPEKPRFEGDEGVFLGTTFKEAFRKINKITRQCHGL